MNPKTSIEQTVEEERSVSPVEVKAELTTETEVTPEPVVEEQKEIKYNKYCYIPAVKATTGVNVRKGPSTDYDVIGGLTPNERMPLIQSYSEWDKINYYGEEAWVCNKYLEETDMIIGQPTKVVFAHERDKEGRYQMFIRNQDRDWKFAPGLNTQYTPFCEGFIYNGYIVRYKGKLYFDMNTLVRRYSAYART